MTSAPRGLFLNTPQANCSIHESGRMAHGCLSPSARFHLDYAEIDGGSLERFGGYDFYVFNYHCVTMAGLDTRRVRELPGLKMTLVLEVAPNDPFVFCPRDDFDVYLALDPTMNHHDPRVCAFPRPLEAEPSLRRYLQPRVPVIGSFGFATPGKGFELVVDAVNREFDAAIVRLNIPPATFADGSTWHLHRRPYAEYLADLCRERAKPGVRLEITHEYFSKRDLIGWCARNTLNCFLYDRNQPGLAATTDQAIASGRPLAVSANETFRHIHPYLVPYPRRTLRESLDEAGAGVLAMQTDWSPGRFRARFEEVLEARSLLGPTPGPAVPRVGADHPVAGPRPRILLVNHREARCGVHQYGLNLRRALSQSLRYDLRYAECASESDLDAAVADHRPDAVLYNHYPRTMPWLSPEVTRRHAGVRLGILHETTQESADAARDEWFDALLCPDPTLEERNSFVYRLQRLIPPYVNRQPLRDIPTIGSFGFGIADKGFERVIERVQDEFVRAEVRLHMPFNDVIDPEGAAHALHTAERCRAAVRKPGIELDISHDFKPLPDLLELLGSCHLNAFFYDVHKQSGISSVIEHALAVQRPIAISRSGMFRHVLGASPSICIENQSLTAILAQGLAPLAPFVEAWSEPRFLADTERVLDRVFQRGATAAASRTELRTAPVAAAAEPAPRFNRILDDEARREYEPVIQQLWQLAPAMMARKIPEANVQQAFVVDAVLKLVSGLPNPTMLCVGAHEDTASATLKALGYAVDEIDPVVNCDLAAYHATHSALHGSYDVVLCVSVLEHVQDDETMVSQLADFLASGGVAVLTCDFNDQYRPGDRIPSEDVRLYTQADLGNRLLPRMHGCGLVDDPRWDCSTPDFTYAGSRYTFATLVVRKGQKDGQSRTPRR